MAERASRIPRSPSNRSFIEQMLKWGWEVGKTDGTWQSMFSPPIASKQVRVRVRPATQHEANPTSVFLEVYRLTSNGDGELFWRGPSDMWLQMLSMEKAKAEKAKKDEYEASIAKAAKKAEAQAAQASPVLALVPDTQEGEPMVAPPKNGKLRDPAKGVRLGAKDVLEVLTEHDGPMTVKSIGKALGLDMSDQQNIADVANRGSYLVTKGLAERVMQGTYRVSNEGKTIDARVQHDGIHRTTDTPVQRAFDMPAVTQHQAPAQKPEVVPVAQVAESVDDVIEAVLDLLLPQGFKASHLRFIAPWVEATKRMVQEVGK
jgi:hypothetical protein